MKYLQKDNRGAVNGSASELAALPRRVYGHVESMPNRVIAHRHRHPWIQLAYAARGVIEVRAAAGLFLAPPQRAVWIPAGMPHQVRCAPGTQIRSLYIEPGGLPAGAQPPACRVLEVEPLLRELIRAFSLLPAEYREDGPDGRLAGVLLDQLLVAPETGLMLPLPAEARLRRTCMAMQARPASHHDLDYWAARLGISGKTLSRLFIRHTGLSFRLWRQRLRLLTALPALERGQRVTDVALDCGYESVSAFIAAFREQLGTTPGEFFGARAASEAEQQARGLRKNDAPRGLVGHPLAQAIEA